MLVFTLLGLLLLSFKKCHSYNASDFMLNYPTAYSPNNRILGMVLAYNFFTHIDPLMLILNEYVSMCESGFLPTVYLYTTIHPTPTMKRYFKEKSFCYRINGSYEIVYDIHPPNTGTALAAMHRKTIQQRLEDFDIFLYHEDDIIFRYHHLIAFLQETKKLHEIDPVHGLMDHVIGFQRYRRLMRGNIHEQYHEQDVFEQELLEEMPTMHPICLNNKDYPYLAIGGNTYQAMYIFTQQQMKMLNERCNFMNMYSPSREFMASFSVYDRKNRCCAMNKLIPGERLATFAIQHYYQQRHVSWTPVFFAVENIKAGFHYHAVPRSPFDNIPPCWEKVVKQAQLEQSETSPPTLLPTGSPVSSRHH